MPDHAPVPGLAAQDEEFVPTVEGVGPDPARGLAEDAVFLALPLRVEFAEPAGQPGGFLSGVRKKELHGRVGGAHAAGGVDAAARSGTRRRPR